MSSDETIQWIGNILSVYVVTACLVMRVPQIIRVLKSGTTHGLSPKGLIMEFYSFSIIPAYSCANSYPLLSYVEFLFLSAQDVILLFLLLREKKQLNVISFGLFGAYSAFLYGFAMGAYPSWLFYAVTLSITPLAAASKVLQLKLILDNKDAGSVSPTSWGIGTSAALARLFTRLFITPDIMMILNSVQAAMLNAAVTAAAIYYGPKAKKS